MSGFCTRERGCAPSWVFEKVEVICVVRVGVDERDMREIEMRGRRGER